MDRRVAANVPLDVLRGWAESQPSAWTQSIYAEGLVHAAWEVRGRAFAKQVDANDWKPFADLLTEADTVRYRRIFAVQRDAAWSEADRLIDELDVSDLESEAAHRFDVYGGLDQDNQVVTSGEALDENGEQLRPPRSDGGRLHRTFDQFTLHAPEGKEGQLLLRAGAEEALTLIVQVGDRSLGQVEIPPGAWSEKSLPWPSWASSGEAKVMVSVERRKGETGEVKRFSSFHYWLYAP